jgi:hypothetical protein
MFARSELPSDIEIYGNVEDINRAIARVRLFLNEQVDISSIDDLPMLRTQTEIFFQAHLRRALAFLDGGKHAVDAGHGLVAATAVRCLFESAACIHDFSNQMIKLIDSDNIADATLLSQPLRMKPLLKAKELKRLTSECLACLIGIMEASPNKRTHTKAQLRQEARKIWPHLSLREFEHLRLLAIDETGAETWRHSGAPRKEPQNKR